MEETARLLTGRLSGLTVLEIKRSIGERLKGMRNGDSMLLDVIMNMSRVIFGMFSFLATWTVTAVP